MALCFTIPGGRASPVDFTAAVAAALFLPFCFGPRKHSFTRGHCGIRFCLGTVLCNPKRPSSTSRPRNCYKASIGLLSGPRGPGFIRRHCERGCCRDTVLGDPQEADSFWNCSSPGRVVSLSPGPEDPASPEYTVSSTTVFGTSTNCSAICGTGNSTDCSTGNLSRIEAHAQFARRSVVALVHAGPASPPRLRCLRPRPQRL